MSATHVGDNSGSTSRMTLIVAGLTVTAVLLYLTGIFYYLPEFVLGVIVIFAVKGALKVRLIAGYYGTQRIDFYCAMVALFGVLVFEVLIGLMLAVIIAIGLVILRVSNERGTLLGRMPDGRFMDLSLHPEAREIDRVKILRLNVTMFYANAPVIRARLLNLIREDPRPKLLIIDMEAHYLHLDIRLGSRP